MTENQLTENPDCKADVRKRSRWFWPLGMMATGLAGAAVAVLRGCWHRNMSWPVRAQGYSYQVCLGCGIKRLFDEESFSNYGPYSYDLNELVSWRLARSKPAQDPVLSDRSAS